MKVLVFLFVAVVGSSLFAEEKKVEEILANSVVCGDSVDSASEYDDMKEDELYVTTSDDGLSIQMKSYTSENGSDYPIYRSYFCQFTSKEAHEEASNRLFNSISSIADTKSLVDLMMAVNISGVMLPRVNNSLKLNLIQYRSTGESNQDWAPDGKLSLEDLIKEVRANGFLSESKFTLITVASYYRKTEYKLRYRF